MRDYVPLLARASNASPEATTGRRDDKIARLSAGPG